MLLGGHGAHLLLVHKSTYTGQTASDILLLVDEAMERLAAEHPDAARFVELRFFAGLSNAEAAQVLGLPERTARRHWTFARAWLYREIRNLEAAPAQRARPSLPLSNHSTAPPQRHEGSPAQ
jgi:ECF sigma factor